MSFVYSRSALWNIFSTINGIPRLESTTWNNLKVAVLRGWLLDVVVELVLRFKDRFLQFKVMVVILYNSQFQFRHLSLQNDYHSPFMKISSNLFDRDFHNNMLY